MQWESKIQCLHDSGREVRYREPAAIEYELYRLQAGELAEPSVSSSHSAFEAGIQYCQFVPSDRSGRVGSDRAGHHCRCELPWSLTASRPPGVHTVASSIPFVAAAAAAAVDGTSLSFRDQGPRAGRWGRPVAFASRSLDVHGPGQCVTPGGDPWRSRPRRQSASGSGARGGGGDSLVPLVLVVSASGDGAGLVRGEQTTWRMNRGEEWNWSEGRRSRD